MMLGLRGLLKGGREPDPQSLQAKADQAFATSDLGLAVTLTRELADGGDPAAMHRMGEVFEHGLGVLQDFAQALEYYEKAADAGHIESWSSLGDFYLTGRGNIDEASDKGVSSTGARKLMRLLSVQPDHARAVHWNKRAADAGVSVAQARLGLQYVYGLGLERDVAEAERLFLAAAEKGELLAQRGLGMLYASDEGEEARYPLAERWFRAASDAGDHSASGALAMLIIHGHAGNGRHEEAFRLMSKAAEAGHVEAMLILGSLYRDGLGTARDLSAAETWFRRASVRGSRNAMLSLGFLLIEALEPKDYISGASVFREAAEQGDPVGQYVLGRLYLNGFGVPQDDEKAVDWISRATEQGLLPAVEALAALYAGGRGVVQDRRKAIELFEEAVQLGSVDGLYHKAMLLLSQDNANAEAGATQAVTNNAAIVALLEESVTRGSAAAALQLGIVHAEGLLVPQDYASAARWYRCAVELGSSDGLFNLAFLKLRGLDTDPADSRTGAELLEQAANAGNRSALWALHNIYAGDEYGMRHEALAEKWLVEAARSGSGSAAVRLADMLGKEGGGKPVGTDEVLKLLQAAADAGETEAHVKLGLMLAEGRHVTQNEEVAFRLMHRAAEAGHAFAQAWLGDVLYTGQGVIKDVAQAIKWYECASEQGHEGATRRLRVIID